ncbi:FHA domain-containing protein [Nocardioides sambongensis]|uniref:FHA domain-containing protein n=1 Tax=Nocardioides sambongensis TaxID=2589074 RepID=UPI00112CFF30|nr:FHA domain-containing protein [Nocardioides sambongensis]
MSLLVEVDGRTLRLDEKRTYLVGRAIEADVVLTAGSVSRQHAEIRPDGDGWVLVDRGSQFGTFVGGNRLSEIRIDRRVVVRCGPEAPGAELVLTPTELAGDPPTPAFAPAAPPAPFSPPAAPATPPPSATPAPASAPTAGPSAAPAGAPTPFAPPAAGGDRPAPAPGPPHRAGPERWTRPRCWHHAPGCRPEDRSARPRPPRARGRTCC